jgi:5-methylcytosine-specific restriction endonuclease McrA
MARICNTCFRIFDGGGAHCPPCQQQRDRAHSARSNAKSREQGRTTSRWRRLRLQVLARDGYTCQRCGAQPHPSQLHAHLDPRLAGDHWIATVDDCTTLCRSCHGTIDAPRSTRRT